MNPIELGKFIASLRNEKGLTQEDLAEMLYIDKRKISRWECGTSIPDFDMLIKLSEILDISLYELSICKKIENEKLTKKMINSFKNIKDFKKYSFKRKIKYLLLIIFIIIFGITLIYTIKHNDTVEIYQLDSLDDKYYIEGNYIKTKDFYSFYINRINTKENKSIVLDNCEYEIYDNKERVFHIIPDDKKIENGKKSYYVIKNEKELTDIVDININCIKNKQTINYSFKIKLTNVYNNKLF